MHWNRYSHHIETGGILFYVNARRQNRVSMSAILVGARAEGATQMCWEMQGSDYNISNTVGLRKIV